MKRIKFIGLFIVLGAIAGCDGLNNPISTKSAEMYVDWTVPAECKKSQNNIDYVKVGCQYSDRNGNITVISDDASSTVIDGAKYKPALNPNGVL